MTTHIKVKKISRKNYGKEFNSSIVRGVCMFMISHLRLGRTCGTSEGDDKVGLDGMKERTRERMAQCQMCAGTLSLSNRARHRWSCKVWEWDPETWSSH